MPALILQTLVENAVKHGICKAREGGEVVVSARSDPGGELTLTVTNTGAPYRPASNGEPQTGLRNTRERLALLYGRAGKLEIDADPAAGTRIRVVVPVP